MRDAAMLLLLRRPLWDAVTFSAFDKVRKSDGSREVPPGTTSVLRTEGKIEAQIEKQSLCSNDRASLISKLKRNQLDATNSELLVISSISTCFGHLYANRQEIQLRSTAYSCLSCERKFA